MNITAITQKGTYKSENEDRIIAGNSVVSEGAFRAQVHKGVIAVADGVGGNKAGAVASHFVATRLSLLEAFSEEALAEINRELLSLSAESAAHENMATTLSGVAFGGEPCVFSVGNTRVYLLQGRKYLKQLTADDTTLNYLLCTGRLSAEEAETFAGKNEITACFGGGAPHLFKIKCFSVNSTSAPFLITSDGIHDYLTVDDMEDIIAEYGISEEACEAMISAARNAGSLDDASIIFAEP